MIFKDITPAAVNQITKMGGLPADEYYVQIDARPVGPWKMFWCMTLTRKFDPEKHYLEELGGLQLAIDKPSAIFLVGATIDYDPGLLDKPFWNEVASPIDPDRPVLPKGFVFNNQAIYPQSQFI
jgi:Fe-S cluster assembly iron-binding protein IscA